MEQDYESVLTLRNKKGELVAVYINDIKSRGIHVYGIKRLSLDEIKNLNDDIANESKKEA